MKEQTGETYESSKYAKALLASESKVGKSCYLVASALGALPWQRHGGIVDRPENLHVITFDANALGNMNRFLVETCGAPKEALKYRVYNLQDDMRRVSESDSDYDMGFYNTVFQALMLIQDRAKGVPVVLFSSLTGLAAGVERSIIGPPNGKGYSDPSKWVALAHQLTEIQNFAQIDKWHVLWEAHLDKPPPPPMKAAENPPKESIRVSGKAGRHWAYNVEQVFRIRRQMGMKHTGTKVDQVYLDTQPALDFIASGRGFTEALSAKEPDMTVAFHKLGLQIGRWNAPAREPKAATGT